MKIKINSDDIVLVEEIKDALNKNKKFFGERFCPCVPNPLYSSENKADYICPCKKFREEGKVGETCHCGLYVKVEE